MITVSNRANVDRSVTLCEASHTSTPARTQQRGDNGPHFIDKEIEVQVEGIWQDQSQ